MNKISQQLKSLFYLSGPLLASKMGVPLRGFVATWLFAQLGTNALAAGALTYSLFIAITTFILGVLMSSVGVLTAYATGANNEHDIIKTLQQGCWLGILLAVPAMIILYHIDTLLVILEQEQAIISLATQLANGLAWSLLPFAISINFYKLFINLNLSYVPMFYSAFNLLTMGFFGYGLVFGRMGLPECGIAGIGYGITISAWLHWLILMCHLRLYHQTKKYHIFTRGFYPNVQYLKKLWCIGWPIGTKYTMEFFLFFLIASLIGALTPEDLAVYQVVLQFFMLSSCLSGGVGLSTEALIGQAIGAQQHHLVKPICCAGLLLSISYISLAAIILIVFQHHIGQWFFLNDSNDYLRFLNIMGLIIVFQLFDSLRKVITDILVALKTSWYPLIAELIGLWCISLPLGYFLGITAHTGLKGFLIALIIGLIFSVIAMSSQFRYQLSSRFSNELT